MGNPFSKFESDSPDDQDPRIGNLPDRKLHWSLSVVELQIEVWNKITNTSIQEETIKINAVVAFNNDCIVEQQLQHIINAATHSYHSGNGDTDTIENRVIGGVILNLIHLGIMTPTEFTKKKEFNFGIMTDMPVNNGETSH